LANLILIGEIILVFGIFLMNTSESVLADRGQYEYKFWLSSLLAPLFSGFEDGRLHLFMQIGWWLHLLGILGFILYLPFSKHLHIFLAFPNAYLSNENSKGYVAFMPEIFKEIQSMMNPELASSEASADIPKFGARDVFDLSQKNLLDAYSCTECGRCTSACPANQTGKLLSPRKIMMDTRDRLEEVGKSLEANKNEWKEDGRSLLHDFISVEELRGCTTCNACVEECPVNISPLDIIIQLRRNLIMEESNSPQEWNGMFGNIENNGAPWKFAQSERGAWVN
jgi:heterodisulfide reductase subunit C